MEFEDLIIKAYIVFTKAFYKLDVFEYTPDAKEEAMIQKFIQFCDKEYGISKGISKGDGLQGLGVQYIYNYFVYQYDYWISKETKKNKGVKPIAWIIGIKAFKRFTGRRKDFSWYHANKAAVSRGVHVDDIFKEEVINSSLVLRYSEEVEKQLFHNVLGDDGLINCSQNTSMYNHRSKWCITCKHKVDCKKLLDDNYPEIYIKRGYLKKEKL